MSIRRTCRAVLTRFHRCVSATMREFERPCRTLHRRCARWSTSATPVPQEDDAERAIHAALAATARVGALRDQNDRPLQSRIGIATGLVVIGNLHDDDAPDVLDVAGEPPNLAARLQGIAEAGGIVVAPETRKRVGELFTVARPRRAVAQGIPRCGACLGCGRSPARRQPLRRTARERHGADAGARRSCGSACSSTGARPAKARDEWC